MNKVSKYHITLLFTEMSKSMEAIIIAPIDNLLLNVIIK